MAVYTFHVPDGAMPGDRGALERAAVVRDGFSWGALIFQLLWCLWNGLWLVALAFLLLSLGLGLALGYAGVPDGTSALIGVLLALLFAWEANNLRRLTLERRGLPVRGVVVADSAGEAERRAFANWLEQGKIGQEKVGQESARQGDVPAHSAAYVHAAGTGAQNAGQHLPQPVLPQSSLPLGEAGVIGLFPPAEEPR